MIRALRGLANPFTRMAIIAFVWSHRHSILRWGRSFWNELRTSGRIDPSRLMLMGRVLWAITSDDRLAHSPQLRHVRLDGSTLVVDAKRGWKGSARLVDELGGIAGITAITDASGRPLEASIETTSTT
ncbi:MAG TPA: hypothetical protein VES40_14915 [Ilumatobacteraceae bacterium]|nr:hypothetical protein [Ilumatobacteraceae bacterium]